MDDPIGDTVAMLIEDIDVHGSKEQYRAVADRLRFLKTALEETRVAMEEAYGTYRYELNAKLR